MTTEGSPEHGREYTRELGQHASITEVLEYADGLTRERNEKFFPTLDKRLLHLFAGGVEMFDTVRARAKHERFIPIVASKIFVRALNVLQALSERDTAIEQLMKKYPESGCSYCGKKPCECAVIRPEDKVGAVYSEEQKNWTITQWQQHLKEVYGAGNKAKGLEWVVNRLGSEIGELSEAAILMEQSKGADPKEIEKYKEEAASEAADVIAWIMAACNEVDADLDKTFIDRYGKGCPKCKGYPCRCGEFSRKQERKMLKEM